MKFADLVKAALGAAQQRTTALEAQVAQLVEKLEQVNALAARVTELECKVESACGREWQKTEITKREHVFHSDACLGHVAFLLT